MELKRERLSNFFKDFKKFWDDLKVNIDENKLVKWYTHFEKDYLEVFKVEIEENKEAVQRRRHKDEKLASIKERLLQNRSQERFTNYDYVCFDQNLTDTEKIIAYQKAIDDATRRTIHFASLQGEIMERYYKKSKAEYKVLLRDAKVGVLWAQFLRKLYKLLVVYNQLSYCTVSLRYIRSNFKFIEEICKTDPGQWK